MNIKLRSNKNFGGEKKYTISEEDIIGLGEDSELLSRLPEELKNLPWPKEIQGSGHTYKDSMKYKIWYPEGDKFLSFAVIVHELGHLRQNDIHPELNAENSLNDYDSSLLNSLREKDAWGRGLKRVREYSPEIFEQIKNDFIFQKNIGKFSEFETFNDYYKKIVETFYQIADFFQEFYKNIQSKESSNVAQYVVDRIKNSDAYDLFKNIEDYKCGEEIDINLARDLIKEVANGISEEKY